MTGAIFYAVFLAIYGFIIGKSFKGLNPFLMFLGMVFSLPVFIQADRYQENIIFIPFALGFLWNFTNPIRRVMDFFSDIRYNIQESLRRNRYEKQQQQNCQRTAYHQQDTDDLYRQKEQIEAELRQNQQKAQEDLYEQERQAQQRIKQAAEELRRRQEQFRREQASAHTQTSSSTSTNDLNPDNFNDACEILGCSPNDDLATIKKAYRVLRAMYHPDKVQQFGGRRKEQAELEMQLINRAWERIKSTTKDNK